MLHLVLYVLLAVVVAVGLFLLASRFLPAGEQIAPAIRDEPVWELPTERSLAPEDVDGVRLPVALRGYRFAETDVLLDRLAGELRARDAEIARLRGEPQVTGDPAAPDPTAPRPAGPGEPPVSQPAQPDLGPWRGVEPIQPIPGAPEDSGTPASDADDPDQRVAPAALPVLPVPPVPLPALPAPPPAPSATEVEPGPDADDRP